MEIQGPIILTFSIIIFLALRVSRAYVDLAFVYFWQCDDSLAKASPRGSIQSVASVPAAHPSLASIDNVQ
jgi:hypothetical protein